MRQENIVPEGGKAMLSCLDDQDVKNIFRDQVLSAYTPNTVKTLSQLLTDLRMIRKRGYAVDNEEIEIGLRCVGAPIRDYSGPWSARLASPRLQLV
jgi:DNA-binding IclR family transcriptional regulator